CSKRGRKRGHRNGCCDSPLAVCMTVSLGTVPALADQELPEETALEAQEELQQEVQEETGQPEGEDVSEDVSEEGSESEEPEVPEAPSEEVTSESEKEPEQPALEEEQQEPEEESAEEDILLIAESSEEESEFEETGVFDLAVTDGNGVEVKPWYDESANIYYLFLTNAVSIPELELQVKGIRMEKASKGTLDKKTNCVTGGFAVSGDGITLTAADSKKYNVVVKQSGIPSLSITLHGTTMEKLNSGSKNTKYPGQTVLLTDASGAVNLSESDVEIKGRGNTTWDYSEKKPYQIKFSSKKSVLGMAKAKKWVLLASAFDDSMLRNKTAFDLADRLGMRYSPDLEFVDLWIDGVYRGTYSIGEKCEINGSRLDLKDPLGALVELDNFFYRQEDYWYDDSVTGCKFALAEAVDENRSQAALNNFASKMSAFGTYLFNTNPSAVTLEKLGQYLNVEDAAKWYLVNEYMSNIESYSTSWFWYCDGPSDVLHMGPVWDFDTSQGIPTNYSGSTLMFGKTYNRIFKHLMQSPAFAGYVKQVYKQYRGTFSGLAGRVSTWGTQLSAAADGNYIRWKWLGGSNLKGKAFASTYAGAIADLRNWLIARDAGFGISVPTVPTANTSVSVSDSGRYMTVKATEVTGTSSAKVAVWSRTGGQDDLVWYDLSRNSDGTMSVKVDLKKHGSSDTYYAHIYSGSTMLGAHTKDVTMKELKPEVLAELGSGSDTVRVTVKNIEGYTSVNTAIWSAQGGQDDLKWFTTAVNGKNEIIQEKELAFLKHTGNMYIHVYGVAAGKMVFLGNSTLTVTAPAEPAVTVTTLPEGGKLRAVLKNASSQDSVSFAVWGQPGGQNDIRWYNGKKASDGTWTADISLENHQETGLYFVHVYGVKNGKQTFQAATTHQVETLKYSYLEARLSDSGKILTATLENGAEFSAVSMAVWGQPNGQNDIHWYNGRRNIDGSWSVSLDLTTHKETGVYYIHAYGVRNGKNGFVDSAKVTVETFKQPEITAYEKNASFQVKAAYTDDYTKVRFAIWTEEKGQDDLKWYTAAKYSDGSYRYIPNLAYHGGNGSYIIHAYGTKNGKETFIGASQFVKKDFPKPEISAVLNSSKTKLEITITNPVGYSAADAAVWGAENGQNDLVWYQLKETEPGVFKTSVPLEKHGEKGLYQVHVYGRESGKQYFMNATTAAVS
ncbi:MAG: GBS Bsp-like repeat-containing protein, partial [Lachnospiraceae bacterium]|nr:GBS Bsp-like repeat-containing protein [Lachnospiraceae bacterium]